ncbi:DNA-binding response regulator, LuxR family [Pseudoalteromonas luteoviolacea B = ATCC 29581]|nr:DNA-binding response regulator, LuxR family [Pseudoalteromonas luteoviolacea B = ATCC 29581]
MNILYFEDEQMVWEMTARFLKKQGHSVTHFDSYAAFQASNVKTDNIDLVLLDIEMPNMNGYEICRALRNTYIEEFTPVIFTSGLMEAHNIQEAFEAGGNDYLTKPLKLGEMKAKLAKVSERVFQEKNQQDQIKEANDVAIRAMTTSGDLGCILHFHDACASIHSPKEIVAELSRLLTQFDLKASIYVHSIPTFHLSYTGVENALELKTIELLRESKRIHTWDNRAIYNFDKISVLILNMPVEDMDRFGEVNDLVCLILNGVNARLNAIETRLEADRKSELLETLFATLTRQTVDLTKSQMSLGEQFERVLVNLEVKTMEQVTRFNLIEEEENALLGSIKNSLLDAMHIFEKSEHLNNKYNAVVSDLKSQFYQ